MLDGSEVRPCLEGNNYRVICIQVQMIAEMETEDNDKDIFYDDDRINI